MFLRYSEDENDESSSDEEDIKDLPTLVQKLHHAEEQGKLEAKFMLAYCYEVGQGVAQDVQRALELYTQAGKRGHVWAAAAVQRLQSRSVSPGGSATRLETQTSFQSEGTKSPQSPSARVGPGPGDQSPPAKPPAMVAEDFGLPVLWLSATAESVSPAADAASDPILSREASTGTPPPHPRLTFAPPLEEMGEGSPTSRATAVPTPAALPLPRSRSPSPGGQGTFSPCPSPRPPILFARTPKFLRHLTTTSEAWPVDPDLPSTSAWLKRTGEVVDQGLSAAVQRVPLALKVMFHNGNELDVVELCVLLLLDHPNIVQLLTYDADESYVFLFLECVPGGTLATRVQKSGAIPSPQIWTYTKQLLQAFEYMHGMGIAHYDVKGANVLLTEDHSSVKLADLGAARVLPGGKAAQALGDRELIYEARGTMGWMAPEVIRGLEEEDGQLVLPTAADIWGLGCTIAEMRSGFPPWPKEIMLDPATVKWHIVENPKGPVPHLPPGLPLWATDLVRECLCPEWAHRPTAEHLLAKWFSASSAATAELSSWANPRSEALDL
eukprot:RCo054961